MIILRVTDPRAIWPVRAHPQDAGLDLHVMRDVWLWPFIIANLPTGWRVKVPDNHLGLILPRSSTFKRMHVAVHTGLIDPSYTGELSVLVRNLTPWPRIIRRGTRLAQMVIVPCITDTPRFVSRHYDFPETGRNEQGFGSTGYGL